MKDAVVLLTGACGDIGGAVARKMAGCGANVMASDLYPADDARVESLLGDLKNAGGRARYLQADVTHRDAIDELVAETWRSFERLDVSIGNAAIVDTGPFLEISEPVWRRHLEVNLDGCFHVGQAAARSMAAAGKPGKILFVSSWVQDVPWSSLTAYCVSKSGLKMLARCMALELAQHGIQVNLIAPGFVDAGLSAQVFAKSPETRTEAEKIVPLGHIMTAEQVADAVLTMCSPALDYMTGATLLIDGGNSLFYRKEPNP